MREGAYENAWRAMKHEVHESLVQRYMLDFIDQLEGKCSSQAVQTMQSLDQVAVLSGKPEGAIEGICGPGLEIVCRPKQGSQARVPILQWSGEDPETAEHQKIGTLCDGDSVWTVGAPYLNNSHRLVPIQHPEMGAQCQNVAVDLTDFKPVRISMLKRVKALYYKHNREELHRIEADPASGAPLKMWSRWVEEGRYGENCKLQ